MLGIVSTRARTFTPQLVPYGHHAHILAVRIRAPRRWIFQIAQAHPYFASSTCRCARESTKGGTRKRRGKGLMPALPKQDCDPPQSASTMRVYVISDLHTDYGVNMEWVKNLSSSMYKPHTLIVAGDVSETLENFANTMAILKEKFEDVFFVPGNHDLWCKSPEGDGLDSVMKLRLLTDVCKSLGIHTSPKKLNGVWIYPLLSWYHQSFDKEKDIDGYNIRPPEKVASDFRLCKWPPPLDNLVDECLAHYFDELNVDNSKTDIAREQQDVHQIITFSHFLPRFELCPEKRMLFYPNLPKVVGSRWLEARLRRIHGHHGSATACHVFGHTHFCWDATLDGIRYIQAPLAYPRERERRINGGSDWLPLCLYDSDKGGLVGALDCHWSTYYSTNKRDPDNTELAPWVATLYKPTITS